MVEGHIREAVALKQVEVRERIATMQGANLLIYNPGDIRKGHSVQKYAD